MTSWLEISPDSPFSLENLPFGIISTPDFPKLRPAVAVGEWALDLNALAATGGFAEVAEVRDHLDVFYQPTLNDFAALGRKTHRAVREHIRQLLLKDTPYPGHLRDRASLREDALSPLAKTTTHLPMRIGDYTDFYAGLNHAFNVGVLFRGADNALQPNYRHLPVGYHGRASSIRVSGTPIRRPNGQMLGDVAKKTPVFAACKKLDYELELAVFVCRNNELGEPVNIADADDHVFGYVLMNDWSARDIQAWEYVPLGPFNGKNFGTIISPWVVLADALEPFRTVSLDGGSQEGLLPYLRNGKQKSAFDVRLTVELGVDEKRYVVSRTNTSNLLYSMDQMIAHHTVTGCNLSVGDLLGSGTISGTTKDSAGSLLEPSENGKTPIQLGDGVTRTFLEDGDEVIMTGVAGERGSYVGFGECKGKVLPAIQLSH